MAANVFFRFASFIFKRKLDNPFSNNETFLDYTKTTDKEG